MMPSFLRLPLLVLSAILVMPLQAEIEFNRDIRPILSDNCFHCHGPDEADQKAGLRLDTFEGAIADGAIVPGSPEKSLILERMHSTDPDEVMPPPESKLPRITEEELELLSQWIREGAEYQRHWSFEPLAHTRGKGAPSQRAAELDQIVIEGLADRGLDLQDRAKPTTLARRLSFDLTGLPPEPESVDAFVEAWSKDPAAAFEQRIDALLASPAFGERMAVDWLDVSRYADSFGYQVDRPRNVWVWRDWVVKAFNDNLPFDDFVSWQVAGDMLPGASDEQILATAFNRLHQQESEGGSVEEEYRVEYVCDRVQTFATAFLGLTLECARCHDHKYDPISQEEFFGLFSFFQNIDEAGLYSYFTPSAPTPAMAVLSDAEKEKKRKLEQAVQGGEKAYAAALKKALHEVDGEDLKLFEGEILRLEMETEGEKRTLVNAVDDGKPATVHGENKLVQGRFGKAIQFTGDDPVTTEVGNFRRHDPFSVSLWLSIPDEKERAVVFHRSRAWTDAASRGYELLIEEGRLKWSLIHFWPGDAISIRTVEPVVLNEWQQVSVVSDGSSRADGLSIWVNGQAVATEVIRDQLTRDITGGGGDHIALGERFRDRGFKGGAVDSFRVWPRELSPLERAALALENPDEVKSSLKQRKLHQALLSQSLILSRTKLHAARAALTDFNGQAKEIMVMRELPEPKQAYILFRGEYHARRDPVEAQVPAALNPWPEGAPMNRLGLAQWLTSPEHPLMARVTVNRIWASIMGRGLVKTAEDFGSQGERPQYPELLDALAEGFIASDWDVKALVKTILLTRVYQQRSVADAEVMANDPDNQWLARGPRFRLPAEMIRDNALAAAGLLDLTMGGEPVSPYELAEGYKPVGIDPKAEVFRRSLYTNWRRTSPPPAMLTFNAPSRAVCTAQRDRTNSPLQALILLNGEQYVEAARVLGERAVRESKGEVDALIDRVCRLTLSRSPDETERAILRQLLEEQRAAFATRPEAVAQLRSVGRTEIDESLDAVDVAAATVLAQALMNHDESVVKR